MDGVDRVAEKLPFLKRFTERRGNVSSTAEYEAIPLGQAGLYEV